MRQIIRMHCHESRGTPELSDPGAANTGGLRSLQAYGNKGTCRVS